MIRRFLQLTLGAGSSLLCYGRVYRFLSHPDYPLAPMRAGAPLPTMERAGQPTTRDAYPTS
jgi:hypothetical protein